MTTSLIHLTPLERWKQLAKAENAAMWAVQRGQARPALDPAPDSTPDKAAETQRRHSAAGHRQDAQPVAQPGAQPVVQTVAQALATTSALSSEVLRLFCEERHSLSEISERLSLPPARVWTLLRLARHAQQDAQRRAAISAGDKDGTPDAETTSRRKSGPHLARELGPLFEAGRLPHEVAAHIAVSEAEAWRGFAVWMGARQTGRKDRTRPASFYRLRLRRVQALMAGGLTWKEAAACLGVNARVLRRDRTRFRDIPPLDPAGPSDSDQAHH